MDLNNSDFQSVENHPEALIPMKIENSMDYSIKYSPQPLQSVKHTSISSSCDNVKNDANTINNINLLKTMDEIANRISNSLFIETSSVNDVTIITKDEKLKASNSIKKCFPLKFDESDFFGNVKNDTPSSVDLSLSKELKQLNLSSNTSSILDKGSEESNSIQAIMNSDTILKESLTQINKTLEEIKIEKKEGVMINFSSYQTNLIGDFSKPYALPLINGSHEGFASISVDTLTALIRGEFNDNVNSFKIVDCRHPYEFEGGHIYGAINLYNKDMILQNLINPLMNVAKIEPNSSKRNILIFHSEYSTKRGPFLLRALRCRDRHHNSEYYPALHYPEVYILHGGYKAFYYKYKNFCLPEGYKKMTDRNQKNDLQKILQEKKKKKKKKFYSHLLHI